MTGQQRTVALLGLLAVVVACATGAVAAASAAVPVPAGAVFDEGLTSAVEVHAAVDAHLDAAMEAEAQAWAAMDQDMDLDMEAEAEAEAGAEMGFPISRREANLTTNCMDVTTAVCLGNASHTGRKGLFAIGRDAHPLGLIGHWTFDDAAAQDVTGNMDALYPRPRFGPGLNGGASAYFNGTALHWLSPARTRHTPGRVSDSERDLQSGKMDSAIKAAGKRPPAPAPSARKGKKNANSKKQKKQKKLSRSTKAAIALARTKAGGGVGAGMPGPHAGPSGAEDLTVSFWVYLLGDVVGKFRTLVYRGDRDGATPHISLWPEIRRIHLRASTGYDPVTHAKTHITLDSHSAVVIGRWTHIAFVVQGTRLVQLYVNGVLDTQKLSLQPVRIHHASDVMYLANSPFAPNSGVRCYMDSVQIFSRALTRGQVTAIGSLGFPGVDAASVKLGCASCSLANAQRACRAPNHLCTQTELNSGALVVARSMGWLSNLVSVHVFSGEELTSHSQKQHKATQVVAGSPQAAALEAEPVSAFAALGAGLCCRNT